MDDVDRAPVDHLAELVRHQHLAGADRDRALVADALLRVEVEDRHRILEPFQVERLQRPRQADRGLDVEAEVAVERDLGVGAGDLADDRQALDRQADLVVAHLAVPRVAVDLGRDPLGVELEVGEAVGHDTLRERPPLAEVARVGDAAPIEVDADLVAERAAEEVVDGRVQDLARQVAQRHLDAADGPGRRPVDRRGRAHLRLVRWQAAGQHRPDERADGERVAPDQPFAGVGDGLAVAEEAARPRPARTRRHPCRSGRDARATSVPGRRRRAGRGRRGASSGHR